MDVRDDVPLGGLATFRDPTMRALAVVDGMRLADVRFPLHRLGQRAVVLVQDIEVLFRQLFNVNQPVTGPLRGGDEFIELEVNGQ